MGAGVFIAAELVWPTIDLGQEWLSYGRLRTLHTNGVIFGFGVSALMATAFYSVQRTSHVTPLCAETCMVLLHRMEFGRSSRRDFLTRRLDLR